MAKDELTGLSELTRMLQIPCPSGREERMAAHLATRLQEMGAEPHRDGQGNLWVTPVSYTHLTLPTICSV